jgi:hypothetical protein
MKVFDLFIDPGYVLSDSLVVLITALDVLLPHHEEQLCDELVVPDHLAPARPVGVVAQDVQFMLLVVELLVPLAVDRLLLEGVLSRLLVVGLTVETGTLVHVAAHGI